MRRKRARGPPLCVKALLLALGGVVCFQVYRQWRTTAPDPPPPADAAAPRVERRHEVIAAARLPPALQPLLAAEAELRLPAQCHARAHTELDGRVVQWGASHLVADAAECCAACGRHEKCNVWVFCGEKERCGERLGQCWLKRADDPTEPPSRGSSLAVPWTSGTVLQAGASVDSYKVSGRRSRALRQQSALTLLESAFLTVGLRNETGTIELLTPHSETEPHFSFPLPLTDTEVNLGRGQYLDRRSDVFHHLGDLTLHAELPSGEVVKCSSVGSGQVAAAAKTAIPGSVAGGTLFHADSSSSFVWRHTRDVPLSFTGKRSACPVAVVRRLTAEDASRGGGLVLSFELTNRDAKPIKLSSLGLAMPFDQDFVGRTLTQVAAACSFVEPYLGAGGGYVQVTRATGVGPVLLLLPEDSSEIEAWRPLRHEDGMRLDFMYENTYELLLHSEWYARTQWGSATPWNEPTSATLQPGEKRTYSLRMLLAPKLQDVEATLLRARAPVAQLLPGPVIHSNMVSASLLLSFHALQEAATPPEVTATPASALSVKPCEWRGGAPLARRVHCPLVPGRPPADGRVRLTLLLRRAAAAPPLKLTVHLFVAEPAETLVRRLGAHGAAKAWLPVGAADPWHRDGAFFGWSAAAAAPVTQERRVYMSGLSDEAGAAAGVAMAVKQLGQPDAAEIDLLEQYVNATLYQGSHPDRNRFLQASADDSVRLSLLYWTDEMQDPNSAAGRAATAAAPRLAQVCRGCWPSRCSWMDCWSLDHSLESWRAYNYPHVTTVYWVLYRLARWHSPALTRRATWQWYLGRAYATARAVWTRGGDPWTKKQGGGVGTTQWGLMVGSVFELVLTDLWREGWDEQAAELQRIVEKRMAVWLHMPFPYGSEFAWDSTGHEEISTWMLRFGRVAEARQTLDAVTAYVSYTPHWAYCGSARRWWDFTINGANARGNERVMHHYAAALNSIPIFDHAVRSPEDSWLWRLAACAGGGSLTNIRSDGSASMGLHGDPDLLTRDDFSADFGVGFYGHWKNAGAYLSCSAELGWLCIGCDLISVRPAEASRLANQSNCDVATELRIMPRDAFHRRLYLMPLGIMLVVEGASIGTTIVTIRPGPITAVVELAPVTAASTHAMLTLSADGAAAGGRSIRMRCSAPCGFEPTQFAGKPSEVYRLRLGSERAALELSLMGA